MSDIINPYSSAPRSLSYPAVSIIIALYNNEKYIVECLDSILNQTFADFEVIVVDDCSTDGSFAVVESYKSKFKGRLTLFKLEKNSGGGYTPRNKGLLISRGEYIYFVDSDDFISESALETLYNAAKKYDADVVYTGSYQLLKGPNDSIVFRDGEGKKLLAEGREDKPDLRVNDQCGNLNKFLLEERDGNFRNPWTKFVRRDLLLKNEIYFPKIPIGEDFIWVINVYCHAKRFLRISTPLYFYRNYNATSVTRKNKEPAEQVSYWISVLVGFMKNLSALENENKILSENHAYCFAAFKGHFEWVMNVTGNTRNALSAQDIYSALYRELSKDSSNFAVPFLISFIDAENKDNKDNLQTIGKLKKEIEELKKFSAYVDVSVIIPMYNAEEYISECLDSLLAQTFRDFEVIVVDDCSTDNSVGIVKSYEPKFKGRLTLTKTEENSGSAAARNKGLSISRGEFIQFLDADDMLSKTALAELTTLAKEYKAEIVYCEKFYSADENGRNLVAETCQNGKSVSKPIFETEDLSKKVQQILEERYSMKSWNKFVRRNFITENEIFFPDLKTGGDNIWAQDLLFCAKRFLRVPNAVYIRRLSENLNLRSKKTPQQQIIAQLNPILLGLKSLNKSMSKHDFFKTNPLYRFALLKNFIDKNLDLNLETVQELDAATIYSTIKDEFGKKLGEYDVLISALCTALYNKKISATPLSRDEKDSLESDAETLLNFQNYFTARLDIKMLTTNRSDFRIISFSDDRALIRKPDWFNKDGVGYLIQSYVGKLDMVFKSVVGGEIAITLRGIYLTNPKNASKTIPYWIDYTKFAVNGEIIFDELTPIWHDKPYNYTVNAKAGEDITVSVEWLPHKSDT